MTATRSPVESAAEDGVLPPDGAEYVREMMLTSLFTLGLVTVAATAATIPGNTGNTVASPRVHRG
jgi:hypothetical protein